MREALKYSLFISFWISIELITFICSIYYDISELQLVDC